MFNNFHVPPFGIRNDRQIQFCFSSLAYFITFLSSTYNFKKRLLILVNVLNYLYVILSPRATTVSVELDIITSLDPLILFGKKWYYYIIKYY